MVPGRKPRRPEAVPEALGSQGMTPEDSLGAAEDLPLPPPVPGAKFERLNRRQSLIAWAVGLIVGAALAAGALLALVPDLL